MNKIESSQKIITKAEKKFSPYARVIMFSGGDDSLAAYLVSRELEINYDYVLHIKTGTGIPDTLDYVRDIVDNFGDDLVVADAGDAYKDYVLRKGFFGRGLTAHNYAYHILKASPYRKAISKNTRKGKRNRPVFLINGARKKESSNRMVKLDKPWNRDASAKNNIWVSLLYDWTKKDCLDFIKSKNTKRNPVSQAMHRSGECMCGTMQSLETRKLAAALYPNWGKWLDELEKEVFDEGHFWGWGEDTSRGSRAYMKRMGQMEFQIMCTDCDKRQL